MPVKGATLPTMKLVLGIMLVMLTFACSAWYTNILVRPLREKMESLEGKLNAILRESQRGSGAD